MGQGLVEFALVGPLFLVLLFGIIEGALMMNAQATLDNAAREGARIAAMCGSRLNTWTYPQTNNQYTASGSSASPCPAAATDVVSQNLGILDTTASSFTVNAVAPASNTPGNCQAPYCAPPGTVIQVTVTYGYNFYIGALISSVPTITMSSTARAVSQQ